MLMMMTMASSTGFGESASGRSFECLVAVVSEESAKRGLKSAEGDFVVFV